MWGTCVDWIPAYLNHCRTLTEVERIKVAKCRVLLYIREFFGCLLIHKYTYDDSGCETEYVCGKKRKKTWLLGEFEGRWSARLQVGEWVTDVRNGSRTGVSERLTSQSRVNVGAVRMDTSAGRCRSDMHRSTGV